MIRDGFVKKILLSCFLLVLLFSTSALAGRGKVSISLQDSLSVPTTLSPDCIDTFSICLGDTINYTFSYYVSDVQSQLVTMGIRYADGELLVVKDNQLDSLFGYYSYVPIGEDTVYGQFFYTDSNGDTTNFSARFLVLYDADPPVVDDQYFSDNVCDLKVERSLLLTLPDGTTAEKLSGPGTLDPNTGLLTYLPDTSGVFYFDIIYSTGCGSDTSLVVDSLWLNTPPQVFCYDSLLYLCEPQEICFDIFAFDPDGEPIEIVMLEGLGQFELTTDTSGVACFTPADVDSATYMFIFRAIDSCVATYDKSAPDQNCCRDTSLITVVLNRPPVLSCPDPQSFFACEDSDFCFGVSAIDPNNDILTYNILSGNATFNDSVVCVSASGSSEFDVVIEVIDECGAADTCTVPVSVVINTAPIVTLPQDFDTTMCEPELICFEPTFTDLENNITSIDVTGAIFNEQSGLVCFIGDSTGSYDIWVKATDSCGLADSALIVIPVLLNRQPTISLGDDYNTTICVDEEVCITPLIIDNNIVDVQFDFGEYNPDTGELCFTPDSSGTYTIGGFVFDDCGLMASDTLVVTVELKDVANIYIGETRNLKLCEPELVCVDIQTNQPFENVQFNIGELLNVGSICFTPDTAGTYTVIASVTDSCGFTATDTVDVNIEFTSAPEISNFNDTTVYLCTPQMICLPVDVFDADNDFASITVNRGTYENGQVCFVPYDSGSYELILTVIDSCGNTAIDTAYAQVTTDQGIDIVIPDDTTFFTCELDTFCFPVDGIPEGANVEVTGINTWFDSENSQICYYAECASTNKVRLYVSTECNTFEKEFSVTILCNTPPLVILPQDSSLFLCEPVEICLPVGVSDVDGNLSSVVNEGGVYDPIFGTICFTPDTAGVYKFSVTATDSCGVTDYDEIYMTVAFNSAPICNTPEDKNYFLCEPGQITLPIGAIDTDGNLVGCAIDNGFGEIVGDSLWVYNAVADENFTVVISCTDDCGLVCTDSFMVDISLNKAPVCNVPADTLFNQCELTEVRLPVSGTDPDGDLIGCSIVSGPGTLVDGFWVYTPTGDETVEVTIRCEDECGQFCESSFAVSFDINDAPICTIPNDTSLFLCDLTEIVLPYSSTDDGDSIQCRIWNDAPGALINGNWVYSPTGDTLFTVTIRCEDECGAFCEDSFTVSINVNEAPQCEFTSVDSLFMCEPTEIIIPIITNDVDNNQTNCEIVSSPGVIDENNNWVYTPTSSETVSVTVRCLDECGAYCESTIEIVIEVNSLPEIADQNFSEYFCYPGGNRELLIEATDPDNDELVYSIIAGIGSIDPITGVLTYTPDTAGTYTFDIQVADECGTVTATITDVIEKNNPPQFTGFDSTIVLCDVEEICFDISGFDPDGDSLVMSLFSGPGQFTQNDRTSGTTCFTPADLDSATYTFVYCIKDSCGLYTEKDLLPPNCTDSVTVTVIIDQAPVISCPEPQNFFVCDSNNFCFEVSAVDPEEGILNFNVISGNATIDGTTVCVDGETSTTFDVLIEVVDDCGHTDTCTVPVNIGNNQPPAVISADDFSRFLCDAEEICVDFTASDLDDNIFEISSNIGTLVDNAFCFTADTAGVYEIIITAVDLCGAIASDTTLVTVEMNSAPVVTLPIDFSVSLCAADEVCFDYTVSDIDNNLTLINTNFGYLNDQTGQFCFPADTAGVYTLIMTATDSCGLTASDTLLVTVAISEGPFVDLGDDLDLMLCDSEPICVDISTIANYDTIIVSPGAYYNEQGQLCFLPDGAGLYTFNVTVVDTCGLEASDEININLDFNQAPVMGSMPDTTVYLCFPISICLPIEITDANDNITSITTNRGTYENGQFCFVPYDSGTYELIITAVDDCGETVADTAVVTVFTDQAVNIITPNDTSFFTCELDTVCFPLNGVPENATVSVSGINTWYNQETGDICFYPECATSNKITVTVSTECNDFTSQFTVTVNCNTSPLIILPQDTTLLLCAAAEVCLPIGVTDVDGNLTNVTVEGGTYDPIMSTFCFNADTAGLYTLLVTATDSCGAIDQDEINVTVELNEAPEIVFNQPDTALFSCDWEEVCFPIDISDVNLNLTSVELSFGTYDEASGTICFTPDTSGNYCVTITAFDECGFKAELTACVDVHVGGYVAIECPTEPIVADSLCGSDMVCVPLLITGEVLSITPSIGIYDNGQLCFMADTAGVYHITVDADADCNSEHCEFDVVVNFKEIVTVECPAELDTLLCAVDTLCFEIGTSASVELLETSGNAYVNGTTVCVPILTTGTYDVTVIGSGVCGADTCSFAINAVLNTIPVITAKDTALVVCTFDTVCVPFTAVDDNNNIMEITAIGGAINGDMICILPTQFGDNMATIVVTDSCGLSAEKIVNVNLTQGDIAEITCPGDQFATLCGPDSVCVVVPILPANADIRILDNGIPGRAAYNRTTGQVCIYMDTEGNHSITVIADAICGSDTCNFDVSVTIAVEPLVTCPAEIDTMLCLVEPNILTFPVTIVGTAVAVSVSPVGTYSAGYITLPVDTAGTYNIEIIAANDCGADTCMTNVVVTADGAPLLTLPDDATFEWCPGDTNTICIDGIFASDVESTVSLIKVCGPGTFEPFVVDSGSICFLPESDGLYTFCFEASDGCNSVVDTFYVDIVEKADCDVCARVTIDGGEPIPVGGFKKVYLNIDTNTPVAGFDLLIAYDASVVAFSTATIEGTEASDWEYFNFRLGSEDCGSACPSGLVRFVGIADINNGPYHPPEEAYTPNGALVEVTFQVSSDQNLGDLFLPINFVWYDCGDNTFSNMTGNILYLDSRIYDAEHRLLWDEFDDVNFNDDFRPFGMGAGDSCMIGDKLTPERCVEFINGGIRIIHPDSIDDRGDLNLNNLAYEIADAVLYSNFFIYGLGVFDINVAGQIAASDVNADGLTLSVADLVLLIRVIIGDADAIPKLNPYAEDLTLTSQRSEQQVTITTNAVADIGGALMVFDIDNTLDVKAVNLADGISNMELLYDVVDNQLRVLVFNIGSERIDAGLNQLLEIDVVGEGEIKLTEAEIVDYQSRSYRVLGRHNELPTGFTLSQNYPNPFNPTTKIEMALPFATDWSLSVYNINGHLVKQFNGSDEAGYVEVVWDGNNTNGSNVASGVYFYRFEAGSFSETKKMILLK